MAAYDHHEQEQLEEIKAWWRQHGNKVMNVVLLVSTLAAAGLGWQWWQGRQTAEASLLYGHLQVLLEKQDAKGAEEMAAQLADKYSRTIYAGMGAMLVARSAVENGDLKNAKVQLAWAADKAADPALRDLAHLRLAALLLDEKAYDEALKQLGAAEEKAFAFRFDELRGDTLALQGKREEARAAYQKALDGLATDGKENSLLVQRSAIYRDLLEIKLESLGGKS